MSTPRQLEIGRLIGKHDVSSQAQLIDLLAAAGYAVTQATVSRDLRALGAVKQRASGQAGVYRMGPDAPGGGRAGLRRALDRYAVGIAEGGGLVVIHTPPGAAQVTAQAIDIAGVQGVVGTVAGDDTILVVTAPGVPGAEIRAVLATREAS